MKRLCLLSILCLLLFVPENATAQLADRTSLNLSGAVVTAVASSSDGTLTVAAAEGPYGLFYSTDFGSTWTLATGGDYSAGTGATVAITDDQVYAVAGSTPYQSSLTTPLSWTEINVGSFGIISSINTIITNSDTLILGTSNGVIASIDASDPANLSRLSSSTLPTSNVSYIAIAPTAGFIYVSVNIGNLQHSYYRTTYNSSTGAIGSSWTEITSNIGVTSQKYSGLFVDPSERVYASTFNAGDGEDGVYRSSDNGATFSRILTPTNAAGADFSGTTYVVGAFISQDSGSTWNSLPGSSTESTPLHLSPNLVHIHPADATKAIVKADVGVAKTSNLDSGASSTWSSANSGLEGVTALEMAQNSSSKDRVFLATNQLFAFTDNFTDEEPTWQHPILPLNDGGGSYAVAIDPDNNDRIWAGSSRLYEGEVDDSASPSTITWTQKDDFTMNATDIKIFSTVSNKLFATYAKSEDSISGGLSIYDLSDSYAETTPSDLDGKPVNVIEAVSSSVWFVGLGIGSSPTSDQSGIWRTSDSGSNWSKVSDSDIPSTEIINDLAYNSSSDILYAAGDTGVYILNTASSATEWTTPSSGLPETSLSGYSAIAVDSEGDGSVYTSVGTDIYESTDSGDTWSVYYEGITGETTSMLFFDDLVQGSNTGFYALSSDGDTISSPTYALWNGNLNMTNVLELVNVGSSSMSVTVKLYDIAGDLAGQTTVSIGPKKQQDIILNDMTGFTADSYGIVKISYASGSLDGRTSFYRTKSSATSGDDYDFAYSVGLKPSLTGTSYVGFNTFNPSTNTADSDDTTLNWLSIVNLDSENERTFTVKRYNQSGTLLTTEEVTVGAFARKDIDGGHGEGASLVGYNKIVPTSSSSPYKAMVVRYGLKSNGSDYSFAFPLLAKAAGAATQWLPISSGSGAQNWVEITNVSSSSKSVTLKFYNNAGETLDTQNLTLDKRAQVNVNASALLASGATGAVKMTTGSAGNIMMQSMFYFNDSSGSIEGMYGAQVASTNTGTNWGSWNLFLGMYNWIRLFNTGSSSTTVTLTVYNDGDTTEQQFTLGAKKGTDVGLHQTDTYGTSTDAVGVFSIQSSSTVAADLLRQKPTDAGDTDFIFPNIIRQASGS